ASSKKNCAQLRPHVGVRAQVNVGVLVQRPLHRTSAVAGCPVHTMEAPPRPIHVSHSAKRGALETAEEEEDELEREAASEEASARVAPKKTRRHEEDPLTRYLSVVLVREYQRSDHEGSTIPSPI